VTSNPPENHLTIKPKMKLNSILFTTLITGAICASAAEKKKGKAQKPAPAAEAKAHATGYTDTPYIPGQKWRVHDDARPRPPVVKPGARFSDMAPPPADAVVLFDGTDLSKWQVSNGDAAKWKIESGYMEVAPKSGSIRTKDLFADFQLHLEFATPAKVESNSQGRGNSGVLMNGIYEVQILESYENKSYADGQAGALYGQRPPRFNAARPPGEWQTYDIIFESPRWDAEGRVVKKAYVTVIHNGVVLHHRQEYLGNTPHKRVGNYNKPHAPEMFIQLQDHNNPTRFRNIWVRSIGEYDALDKATK
jgi:hypothetical protein